jgi:Tol biopolymer transport system component
LDFSPDGQWVTYVAYPEGTLWRSKMDGSQRLQLTFPPMRAYMPRWSPDNQQIAFVDTNRYWKTCLIPANGGEPKQLMPGEHNEVEPGWFPDGRRLVFIQGPASRDSCILKMFDLKTNQVSTVPGANGLGKPRLSSDGRYLSASPMFAEKHVLLVFDFSTQKWKELLNKVIVNERNWSPSGDYIYFDTSYSESPALCRVRVKDGKLEKLASLNDLRLVEQYGVWSGLAPDGPLVLRDIGMQEIYALDWEAR